MGTIAAVAIAFARFAGVLMPSIADNHYLIAPVHVFGNYFVSLSTTQLLAIAIVVLLTFANSLGLNYGRILQNIFTVAKIGALVALVGLGCTIGIHHAAVMENFHHFWSVVIPFHLRKEWMLPPRWECFWRSALRSRDRCLRRMRGTILRLSPRK